MDCLEEANIMTSGKDIIPFPDESFSESPSASSPCVAPPKPQTKDGPSKKSKWTPEEDRMLIESVTKHGMSNWSLVATEVSGRTGKQCRERWTNQLCPSLNKDNWTAQEDQILLKQQQLHGNMWSKIAHFLPGRSSNAVKNRWSWLSRHRLSLGRPLQFAPRTNQIQGPYFQQNFAPKRQAPPIPQIFQTQLSTPPEKMLLSANESSSSATIPFSDPNPFGASIDIHYSSEASMPIDDDYPQIVESSPFRFDLEDQLDEHSIAIDSRLDTYWENGF